MAENQESIKGSRGGPRLGAGRPRSNRWLQARGMTPMTAAQVLENHDERKLWHRVLNSKDDRIVLQALLNLVAWRDGKPAQRINITSTQLTLNSSELEKARAIVAELRDDSQNGIPTLEQHLSPAPRLGSPLSVDAPSGVDVEASNNVTRSLMLSGDGAAEKGGSG